MRTTPYQRRAFWIHVLSALATCSACSADLPPPPPPADPITVDEEACDKLCANAGYGSLDEMQSSDGTLSCECNEGDGEITPSACSDYCVASGRDAASASTADDVCSCGGPA